MPIPVYSICADAVIDDKSTNRISLFNVFDKVIVSKSAEGQQVEIHPGDPVPMMPINVVLVVSWLKEESDFGHEFNAQLVIISPTKKTFVLNLPNTRIPNDEGKWFYRQNIKMDSLPPLFEDGIWYFETRLRKDGENEWISQRTPFIVEIQEPPTIQVDDKTDAA